MRRTILTLLLVLAAATLAVAQTPAFAAPVAAPISRHADTPNAATLSYFRVTGAGALHLRSGPGTTYPVLLSIPEGEFVQALGETSPGPRYQWYVVSYQGTRGYVASDWLQPVQLTGAALAARDSRMVVVSLAQQQLEAYQNGRLVLVAPITTGRPGLATPTGTFSVLAKKSPTTFYSPWPKGSPYYYAPTKIHYAMLFRSGGFYLHDAWWRTYFGDGTNVPHQDPDGATRTGSLGCVEIPLWDAQQLYTWISVGTPVVVQQ